MNSSITSSVTAKRRSWNPLTKSCSSLIHSCLSSSVSSSPLTYACLIRASSSSSSRKKFKYWYDTSTSGLPPSLLCSSADTCPPEKAHLLNFRSEEHTSELQSLRHLVCRLLLEKKK